MRYISDPVVEVDERIGPRTHPDVRAPRHANATRRILYREGGYLTAPFVCARGTRRAPLHFHPRR